MRSIVKPIMIFSGVFLQVLHLLSEKFTKIFKQLGFYKKTVFPYNNLKLFDKLEICFFSFDLKVRKPG